MDTAKIVAQLIIGLGIYNVWILRLGKATAYRGGEAANLKEEFAVYGLPSWFFILIGVLKLVCATALLAGIWFRMLVKPAALGMVMLMVGAVGMHFKVKDPIKKSVPALIMLALSLFVALA